MGGGRKGLNMIWLLKLKLKWQLFLGTNIKFTEAKQMNIITKIGEGIEVEYKDAKIKANSIISTERTISKEEYSELTKQCVEVVEKTFSQLADLINKIPEIMSNIEKKKIELYKKEAEKFISNFEKKADPNLQ
jgi:hypothetical protein